MPGPSRYNRQLKAKNDRKKARAARGGRTPSEAAFGRSMRASGRKVSRTNTRATAPPSTRTFSAPRSPRRARRTLSTAQPPGLPGPLGDAQRAAQDFLEDRDQDVRSAVRTVLSELDQDQRRSERILNDPDASLLAKGVAFVGTPQNPIGPGKVSSPLTRGVKVRSLIGGRGAKAAVKAAKNPRRAAQKAREGGERARTKAKRRVKQVGQQSKTRKGRQQLAAGAAKGAGRGAKATGKAVVRRGAKSKVAPAAGAVVLADDQGLAEGNKTVEGAANVIRGRVDALNPMNPDGKFDPLGFGDDAEDSPLGRSLATTARFIPGAIAGIASGVGAGAETTYRGVRKGAAEAGDLTRNPLLEAVGKDYTGREIASPVVETVTETAKGLEEMTRPIRAGDREGTQEAFETQIGIPGVMFGPRAVSKARNSRAYQGARGVVRDSRAASRAKKRERRMEERRRQADADQTVTAEVPAAPIRDSRSGREDEFVFQGLGRRIRDRRDRKDVARTWDRGGRAAEREANYIARDLIGLIAKGRKIGGKKKSKEFAASLAAALQVVAQQSIGRNPARARYELERLLTQINKGNPNDPSLTGRFGDRQAIRFLIDNPEVLQSDVFWTAVDRAKEVTRAGTVALKDEDGGRRAQYEAAATRMGIPTPERVIETQGVVVNGRLVKGKWTPDKDSQWTADARKLREEARQIDRRVSQLPEGSREWRKAVEESAAKIKAATDLERKRDGLRAAYQIAERDFVDKTRSALLLRGQDPEPGYVRDAERPQVGAESSALVEKAGLPVVKSVTNEKMRTGALRLSGKADRSFDTFIRESILRPRVIKAVNGFTREVIGRYHLKIRDGKGKPSMVNTSDEIARAVARGEVPPGFVAVHSQFYRGSTRGKDSQLDETEIQRIQNDGVEMVTTPEKLRDDIEAGQMKSGHKYILVRKAAWDEYLNQLQGTNSAFLRVATRANRLASTGILGYNPSWAVAQQLAEGLPAILAIGVSPAAWNYVLQAERAYQQMTPEQRAVIDAVSGSAGGTLRSLGNIRQGSLPDYDLVRMPAKVKQSPIYQRLTRRSTNQQDVEDFNLGFHERGWSAMKNLAKGRGLNEIVLATGGVYRRGVMNAEIYRRRRGAILGLARASTAMREIDRRLSKMDAKDAQLYLARNPQQAERLAGYMEDVMGNWTSLTAREGMLAPFTAFYPYLRYSLRWTFYGFPKRHPIKAQILYFLSQQNANQLEEMIGGKPAVWLDYAFPVITKDGGEKGVLPGATRFQPALSAVVEAIGTDKFERLLGTLNPAFGPAIQAITGFSPFQGERIAYGIQDQALLGLSALVSMIAPVRWSDSIAGGGTTSRITPRKDYSKPGSSDVPLLDGVPNRSETSQRFREDDPNEYPQTILDLIRVRSSFNILAPQSAEDYLSEVRRERDMEEGKYSRASGRGGGSSSGGTPTTTWGSGSGGTRQKGGGTPIVGWKP